MGGLVVPDVLTGARIEGDLTAMSVVMEPGAFFTGRCTMLENGPDAVEYGADVARAAEYARE